MNKTEKLVKQMRDELNMPNLPEIKPAGGDGAKQQVLKILTFAHLFKCIITPVGYSYYVDSVTMFGCCPCDQSRKTCPCSEAPGELEKDGHCTCQLFWRDYQTYMTQKGYNGKEQK